MTESFSVRRTPKTVAQKALSIMKRAKIVDSRLSQAELSERGGTYSAFARWESNSLFGGSAEVRVDAEKSYGTTQVRIDSYSDKCAKLVERLRKSL